MLDTPYRACGEKDVSAARQYRTRHGVPDITGESMQTPREMIASKFERSAFTLGFETDEIIGYRLGSKGSILRALYINLEQKTVEYELSQEGLTAKRRTEYCPTMEQLIKDLPVTIDAFDQKLHGGLKLASDRRAVGLVMDNTPPPGVRDPWDLTNYYDKSRTKPQRSLGLKREDEEAK